MATLVVGAALLGFEIWKYCQPPWDGLADQVRTSMNHFLADDDRYRNHSAQVTSITLMHADGNVFEGTATVTASGTASREVPVHVDFDGTSMIWRTDPGALLFITVGSS